jgi:hypothetical protein
MSLRMLGNAGLAEARERGVCPSCKDGNGRQWDGAGSRVDCYGCRGKGTWEAYKLHREFVKGWNAAIESLRRKYATEQKDMP